MTTQLPQIDEIKTFFPAVRKDVLKVFLLLVQCIIRSRTVCLYKCRAEAAIVLNRKDLKLDNVYKQFIRFFQMQWIDGFCVGIAWLIISLTGLHSQSFLVMDRTNWKIGKANINVLFVGLLLPNGAFIPIVWKALDKRGNSNTAEREALIRRFMKAWQPFPGIQLTVLADREFIGMEWFAYLSQIFFLSSSACAIRITSVW